MALLGLLLASLLSGASAHGTLIWPLARQDGAGTFQSPSNCRPLPGCWYFVDIRPKIWPWKAPGTTAVQSPCGTPAAKMPKISHSQDGVDLKPRKVIDWERGVDQPVAWNSWANHGGGVAYRLCPAGGPITEECFQKNHLKFSGNTTVVRYKNGKTVNIPVVKTD